MANFLLAINAFNTSLSQPRVATTEQITKQLQIYFKNLKAILKNIDAAIGIIRYSQLVFYAGYRAARKLINTSVRSLALKAIITDAASNEPITGVKVEFVLEGNTK